MPCVFGLGMRQSVNDNDNGIDDDGDDDGIDDDGDDDGIDDDGIDDDGIDDDGDDDDNNDNGIDDDNNNGIDDDGNDDDNNCKTSHYPFPHTIINSFARNIIPNPILTLCYTILSKHHIDFTTFLIRDRIKLDQVAFEMGEVFFTFYRSGGSQTFVVPISDHCI